MKVQLEPAKNRILYSQKNNNSNINFKSLMYNPQFIVNKRSPVAQFLFGYLRKSVSVSKAFWQPIEKNLAQYLQQIELPNKKRNSTIRLWDINSDNRQKYVIVMHGFCHNISSLQAVYKKVLQETNYGILAQEYSGFRDCDTEYKYLQPKGLLDDAEIGLQYLKNKGIKEKDIYLLGHSFGGYVASLLASKHKDIGGVVLVSPCYSMKTMTDRILEGHENGVPNNVKEQIKKHKIFQKAADNIFSIKKPLKKIKCPIEIIHSNKDRYAKIDVVKNMANDCQHLQSFKILQTGHHKMDDEKIKAIISSLNQNY